MIYRLCSIAFVTVDSEKSEQSQDSPIEMFEPRLESNNKQNGQETKCRIGTHRTTPRLCDGLFLVMFCQELASNFDIRRHHKTGKCEWDCSIDKIMNKKEKDVQPL